jgi:hypothetical protein
MVKFYAHDRRDEDEASTTVSRVISKQKQYQLRLQLEVRCGAEG